MAEGPLRVTGVALSPRLLSVVTLSWGGRRLRLVPTATTFIDLGSDDQAGVRQLADTIFSYFHYRGIDEILVCRGPRTGSYRMSSGAILFETVLQLLPLTCAHVAKHRITNWARADWRLPSPQPGLKSTVEDLQRTAIETAAFGIHILLIRGASHG